MNAATCGQLSSPPPIDTVLLWLTTTVESDLIERGVFVELRRANAQGLRLTSSLHYLTMDRAEAILEDALARQQSACKSMLIAFNALVKTVKAAIDEARKRRAAIESHVAVCTYRSDTTEQWCGTKDQLKAHGIQLDGAWPGEPDGKTRWVRALDSRGYVATIRRSSAIWPDRYEVDITVPDEVWRKKIGPDDAAAKLEVARHRLACMLASPDEFRRHLVSAMRQTLGSMFEMAAKPASWHGYTIHEDSIADLRASFDAVVEAIVGAEVLLDAARHAEIAQKHRAEIAAADETFQAHFAGLVRPNPKILEAGAQ